MGIRNPDPLATRRFDGSGNAMYPSSAAGYASPSSSGDFFGDVLGAVGSVVPFAGPVISLFSGLFGESPEDQYKRAQAEKLQRTIKAITDAASLERAQLSKKAEKNRRFALSSGARRRAAHGYSGDAGVFANADLSSIDDSLLEGIDTINTREQQNILYANAGQETMPSYMFPDSTDYLTTGLSSINRIIEDRRMVRDRQSELDKILEAMRSNYG
jgi:hypothetical protein